MKRIISLLCLLYFVQISYGKGIHVGTGQTYKRIFDATRIHAVQAGDTIYMHAGIYTDAGQVFDSLIGTPNKWIVIRPYQNDSVSIHVQYTFQHAQYLKISGLNFYGGDTSQNGKFYHLLFIDYALVCYTSNHNIIVENCSFTEHHVPTNLGNSAASLKITGADSFIIQNCHFKNCTNIADGISMNADKNGIIRYNKFENIDGNGSHCKGGVVNILYENNLFINCNASAINIGGATGASFFCPSKNAKYEADSIMVYSNITIGGTVGFDFITCNYSQIINNTCYKATEYALRCLNEDTLYPFGNNYCYNNIFAPNSKYGIYMNAGGLKDYSTFYFSNNLYHDYKNADPKKIWWGELIGSTDSNEMIGDPLFTDTAHWDFTLQKGSPAIGTGKKVAQPLMDYAGNYFGSVRSVGALEYSGNVGIKSIDEINALKIYPNPAKNYFTIQWIGLATIKSVEIYNLSGSMLHAIPVAGYQIKINVADLPKGLYQVKIICSNGQIFTKSLILN